MDSRKENELEQQFHACMPLFIALGDEVRLGIIEALTRALQNGRRQGLNVNEITRGTHLSRPAVSHHLKILKESGLVRIQHSGTSNYYQLDLKEGNRELMRLGSLVEEILYRE